MRTGFLAVVALLLTGPLTGPLADLVPAAPASVAGDGVSNVETPRVLGTAKLGRTLRADPGLWDPTDVDLAHRWLRDGESIGKARVSSYLVRRRAVLATTGH